jgi:hypothetical protein
LNLITKFEREIGNKNIFAEAGTLDDQERHFTLEMATSRMAHAERERESTPVKQHQGKA